MMSCWFRGFVEWTTETGLGIEGLGLATLTATGESCIEEGVGNQTREICGKFSVTSEEVRIDFGVMSQLTWQEQPGGGADTWPGCLAAWLLCPTSNIVCL